MQALEKRRHTAREAIVHGFLACLIILQALAFAASPASARNAPGSALTAATIKGDCHAPGGDQRAPAQGHCSLWQCCVLCSASGRDAAELPLAAISFSDASDSAPAPTFGLTRFSNVDFHDDPLGWTSSWSSRAPPRSS